MHTEISDRITMPVPDFLRASGIGRTTLYEMLATGELASITIGRRRLIVVDSYRQLIERQTAAAMQPRGRHTAV